MTKSVFLSNPDYAIAVAFVGSDSKSIPCSSATHTSMNRNDMPPAKKTTKKTPPRAAKKAAKGTMSPSHKKALAEGRSMSASVDAYLAALNVPKKRGRKISKSVLEKRLVQARSRAKTATGVEKLLASQEVRDLQARIAQVSSATTTDLKGLESAFVRVAKTFSEKRGI